MNKKNTYANNTTPIFHLLLRNPLVALASHWVLQGSLYSDPTERRFKIGLDVLLTTIGAIVLRKKVSAALSLILSFLVAHTLNIILNGQIWGVLKHYGYVHNSRETFEAYQEGFAERARHEPSIERVLAYGSLSRQEWKPSSDLDVRILRRPGFINGLRACWFLLKERTRAHIARFPLDAYVVDSPRALQKLRLDETAREL